MRLTQKDLIALTGRSRPTAQLRWFQTHFGITLPADKRGPILTQSSYEELIKRSCGLSPATGAASPTVRMRKK